MTIDYAPTTTHELKSGVRHFEYTINQLTKLLGLTARAIRFYEEKGLVKPGRSWAGRIYTRRDFQRLSVIARGRRAGLSLEDIEEILAAYDPTDGGRKQVGVALDRLHERLLTLDAQRSALISEISELESCRA
ncbi:MAG: MerR family transcriptional regulator [Caulobacteraceae bacterium]|nr:MerR family transcriptional regulator [Caulobacteraceae bacterium]